MYMHTLLAVCVYCVCICTYILPDKPEYVLQSTYTVCAQIQWSLASRLAVSIRAGSLVGNLASCGVSVRP